MAVEFDTIDHYISLGQNSETYVQIFGKIQQLTMLSEHFVNCDILV